jgi:hypothetical protein
VRTSGTILRGGITLPRSSPRKFRTYAKLLYYVDPDDDTGFGFEGKIMRPGSVVSSADLRPGEEYPVNPILLEYAEAPALGHRGHNRKEQLYILWRFDWDLNIWIELGRAMSVAWEWAIDLRPLAVRALKESRSVAQIMPIMPNVGEIAGRIFVVLDGELKRLEPPDQKKVLGILHDQFACRLCA